MNCTRRKKAVEIGLLLVGRATEHLSQNGSEESERRGESSPFWYGHVIEFDVIRVSIDGGGGGALPIQIDDGRARDIVFCIVQR